MSLLRRCAKRQMIVGNIIINLTKIFSFKEDFNSNIDTPQSV